MISILAASRRCAIGTMVAALCCVSMLGHAQSQQAPDPEPVQEPKHLCKKPQYPRASLRFEEQGTVTLSFLIGVDGNVLDKKIVKSSGFERLDTAALDAIAKCSFRPATVDGKPEQSWQPVQYVWSLR